MAIQQPQNQGQTPPAFDSQGFGPQGLGQPPTPQQKKSRLPLILGGVGIVLVLCIALAVVAALVGGGSSTGDTTAAGTSPAGTSAPTGKWSGPDRGKILFGSDFREAKSGGFEALDARTSFKPGVELRMVVQFKEKAGATSLEIILSKVATGGGETVVEKAAIDIASPDSNYYSTTIGTADLGEGTFKVKYVRGGSTVLAEGQFTISPTAAQAR